MEMHTS